MISKLKPVLVTLGFASGAIFLFTGFSKLLYLQDFYIEISNYGIIPVSIIPFAAIIFIISELIAGLTIVTGIKRVFGIKLSIFLLISFIIAIGYNIYLGKNFDCGCSISAQNLLNTILGHTLVHAFIRDIVLLLINIGFLVVLNKKDE